MCFGDTNTGSKTSTATPNPAVSSAATQNLTAAQNLQTQGYTPYSGERVAGFSPMQQQSFDTAQTAGTSVNPYVGDVASQFQNYSSAPAQTVTADTIANNMSPYMNQYVMQALAPQLSAQDQQFAQQNKQLDSAATSSGAFGDSRAGIEAANLTGQQNTARTGLIGNAYNSAFNTAIGAGAQDVSNKMQAQQASGSFMEQALQRALGGGQALTGLDSSQLARALQQAQTLNQYGGQQQQQTQAGLNVPYSDYLAAQQYPFLTSQNLNQAISAGSGAMPASTTSTTTAPNNAGWSLAGAVAPSLFAGGTGGFANSALGMMMLSDERMKDDIEEIGYLNDNQPVFRFTYKDDPENRPFIGLMAQEVEKTNPAAVTEVDGVKYVNYDMATRMAVAMGKAA